jgi:hypothetical protein
MKRKAAVLAFDHLEAWKALTDEERAPLTRIHHAAPRRTHQTPMTVHKAADSKTYRYSFLYPEAPVFRLDRERHPSRTRH